MLDIDVERQILRLAAEKGVLSWGAVKELLSGKQLEHRNSYPEKSRFGVAVSEGMVSISHLQERGVLSDATISVLMDSISSDESSSGGSSQSSFSSIPGTGIDRFPLGGDVPLKIETRETGGATIVGSERYVE